jgi:hypothetical protein
MRTKGAIGKAKYVGVSIDKLRETFGDKAIIYVSIEHHGMMLGVDRDSAPRVKSLVLADAGVAPVASVTPAQSVGVVPVVDIPKEEEPAEKCDAKVVDLGDC